MKKIITVLLGMLIMSAAFAQTAEIVEKLSKSVGTGVTLVTDKDYSKKTPAAIKNISSADSTLAGDSCIQVTNEKTKLIRFAFVFDEPISSDDLTHLQLSIAGFDGYEGYWNVGLLYDSMSGAEHAISCYSGTIKKDAWTDYNFDLKGDEKWNHNFKAGKNIIGIQFYSDQTKNLYIKNLELTK